MRRAQIRFDLMLTVEAIVIADTQVAVWKTLCSRRCQITMRMKWVTAMLSASSLSLRRQGRKSCVKKSIHQSRKAGYQRCEGCPAQPVWTRLDDKVSGSRRQYARRARMPSSALRHATGKGWSDGLLVLEHELELSQNDIPISTSGGPAFDNFSADMIEHLTQKAIVDKTGLILHYNKL